MTFGLNLMEMFPAGKAAWCVCFGFSGDVSMWSTLQSFAGWEGKTYLHQDELVMPFNFKGIFKAVYPQYGDLHSDPNWDLCYEAPATAALVILTLKLVKRSTISIINLQHISRSLSLWPASSTAACTFSAAAASKERLQDPRYYKMNFIDLTKCTIWFLNVITHLNSQITINKWWREE